MTFNPTRSIALAGLAAVGAAALIAPSAGTAQRARVAKTRAVNLKVVSPPKGTKLSGTFTGRPWGKGKVKGTLVIPKVVLTFYIKGGSATMKYTGLVNGAVVTGNYKWVKGTGKLKGIKGGGPLKGDLVGNYTYKGTASY